MERKSFNECIAKNAGTGVCGGMKHGKFCNKHYSQYRSGILDENGNKIRFLSEEVICKIKGCKNKHSHQNGYGLCSYHYKEIVKEGNTDSYYPVKTNESIPWHER